MTTKLSLYRIDPKYLRYLHDIDNRVSEKFDGRPFVGVLTIVNGKQYVLPLSSQTTEKRKARGKKKRPAVFTTFVKDGSKTEIANILHNNMIPVNSQSLTKISVDPHKDTYVMNEIRYIRKFADEIVAKAQKVYERRIANYNDFYINYCCDFASLEQAMTDYYAQ